MLSSINYSISHYYTITCVYSYIYLPTSSMLNGTYN